MKTHGKLSALPLGSVHPLGWVKDQLVRSKNGMGGHIDELEPDGKAGGEGKEGLQISRS